tara:strand:+ start:6367 stop:7566 length:1200 start_codon:yes stop_codon:yes gene_type:complete
MAHLNSKTTDGTLSFEKYVSKNPKWHSGMEFIVENGVSEAPIVEIKENRPFETKLTVSQGDKLYIPNKSYKTINNNKRFVKVRVAKGGSGYLELRFIRKPTSADVMKTELRAIRDLDNAIRSSKAPLTIVVNKTGSAGKYEVKDIVGARKIGGTPKADLALFDSKGNPVFWISHKKAGGASAFQQYSGISAQSGASIYQHTECQNFMRKVVEHLEGEREYERENSKAVSLIEGVSDKREAEKKLRDAGLAKQARELSMMNQSQWNSGDIKFDDGEIIGETSKLSNPLWSEIKDSTLRRMAIYGPDVLFGSKFGQNNIQMIGQGDPVLQPINEDVFSLSFSSHVSTNEDVSGLGGDYEPVFVATYRAGRGFTVDGKTYKGARLGIAPYAMVKNRKGIQKV